MREMIPIQQVAKQLGITVRTLRYYDQIGLLKAVSKTEGGHRQYTEDNLKKLQQIRFLKEMGFRLDEIKSMLLKPDWNWNSALKSQLAYVLEEQERLRHMESSLRELISGIAMDGEGNLMAMQKLIRLSRQDREKQAAFKTAVLSEKEMGLWQQLPRMKAEDPDSLEWIALIGQVQRCMKEGPSSPRIQSIIRRMAEKTEEKFAEEPEFLDKLWELRKSPEASEQLGFYPIDAEVLHFLEKAFELYHSGLQQDSQDQEEASL